MDVNAREFAAGELAAKALEKGLEKVTEWAKEAAEAFKENVFEVVEYADQTRKAAQATGISTKALQELQYAAGLADVGAEEFNHSMGILTRTMGAAARGGEEQGKAFHTLGIKVKDTHGKLRAADEVMGDVAEKFKNMPDGAEKTAAAMQLFGRAGARMIPILNEGRDGLAEMRDEAEELGLVVSDETTKAAEEFNDTLKRIKAVGVGLWRQAIAPLIPAMTELAKRFLAWRKENAAIIKQNIQKYVGYLIKGIRILADAFTFVIKNAVAFEFIIASLTVALIAMNAAAIAAAISTAAAWALAALPFVAIGAAIAALLLIFDDLRVWANGGDSLFGRFEKRLKKWAEPMAGDPWWLKTLKETERTLLSAIDLLKEWDELKDRIFGTQKVAVSRGKSAGPQTLFEQQLEAKTLAFEKERTARLGLLDALGIDANGSVGKWFTGGDSVVPPTPSAPPAGGGARVIVHAPVGINITQQPGQSSEDLANIIDQRIQSHQDDTHEAAAAALGE